MRQIGMELIVEKKAAIMSEISGGKEKYGGRGGARDLLTLLLKANMATDIPDNQRLSDEDVLARTFSLSWCFTVKLKFATQRFLRTSISRIRRTRQ